MKHKTTICKLGFHFPLGMQSQTAASKQLEEDGISCEIAAFDFIKIKQRRKAWEAGASKKRNACIRLRTRQLRIYNCLSFFLDSVGDNRDGDLAKCVC